MGNSKQENAKRFTFSSRSLGILGFLLSCVVVSGVLYATGMFSSLPSNPPWKAPGGTLSGVLYTQVAQTCGTNEFLKGFKADYTPVCVNWDGVSSLNPQYSHSVSGYPVSSPSGQYAHGGFETYFKNLVGVCPGNTIVKGFASDGWKYCVDPATPTTITTPHTSITPSGIAWPTKPTGESTGGSFQTFFTTMFTTCGGTTVIKGINSNGSPNCVEAPVNCVGSWNETNVCSAPCGPGTKQQVYTITTPSAYGWLACSNNSWDIQWGGTSCNMGACCIPNGSCTATPACEQTAYGTDNCGNSCSRTGWSCAVTILSNPSPPGSCPAVSPTSWTINGNTCSGNGISTATEGFIASASDTNWNSCKWTCTGGSWMPQVADCACNSTPPPPPTIPDCPANIDLQWDSDRTWNTPLVDANPPAGFQLPSGNPWCYYEIQNGDRYCGSYDRVTWQRYNTWKCCWDHDYSKAINGGDC